MTAGLFRIWIGRLRRGLYGRDELEPDEAIVHVLRGAILTAAQRWDVSPEIVGAVLWDELERRSLASWGIDLLAGAMPGLAARADLSLGLPQIRPSLVARARTAQGLAAIPRATVVRQLLDPAGGCELLALICRHIIDLWSPVYPDAARSGVGESGARLIGTVYSIGCCGAWGVNPQPMFSRRGLAIAASMELVTQLLQPHPFSSIGPAAAAVPASRTPADGDSGS